MAELKTNKELALMYQTAIEAILDAGQGYTIGDITYTAADLEKLQNRYEYYRKLAQRDESSSGIRGGRFVPL